MCICYYRFNLTFGCFSFVSMRTRHTRPCCLSNSETWSTPFQKQNYSLALTKQMSMSLTGNCQQKPLKCMFRFSANIKSSCTLSADLCCHLSTGLLGTHQILFKFEGKMQCVYKVSPLAVQLAPYMFLQCTLHMQTPAFSFQCF